MGDKNCQSTEESNASFGKRKARIGTSKPKASHSELKRSEAKQSKLKKSPVKSFGKMKTFNKLKSPNERGKISNYVMKELNKQSLDSDLMGYNKDVDLRAKLSNIGQRSKKACSTSKYAGLIETINETFEKQCKNNFSEKLELTVNIASIHETPNGHGEVKDCWQKSVVIPRRQFALKVANLCYDAEKMEGCHRSLNAQMEEMYGLIDSITDRIKNQEDTVQKLSERVSALDQTLMTVQTDKINTNQKRLLDLFG